MPASYQWLRLMKIKFLKERLPIDSIVAVDVKEIVNAVRGLDRKFVSGYVGLLFDRQEFKVGHPQHPELSCRPVKSFRIGSANFLIFTDKEGSDFWVWCQSESFVDLIITSS